MDLLKAFDTVDNHIQCNKFKYICFYGCIFILAYHNNRCVDCLSWDGTYSHNFHDKN